MKFIDAVFNTVRTVKRFEKGYISCKRSPVDYQKRPNSLSEFIEFRINFESFKVDELKKAEEMTDGRLFVVDSIENERGNSYDRVYISVTDTKPEYLSDIDFNDIIDSVKVFIGGSRISFTSDKKNLGMNIE